MNRFRNIAGVPYAGWLCPWIVIVEDLPEALLETFFVAWCAPIAGDPWPRRRQIRAWLKERVFAFMYGMRGRDAEAFKVLKTPAPPDDVYRPRRHMFGTNYAGGEMKLTAQLALSGLPGLKEPKDK